MNNIPRDPRLELRKNVAVVWASTTSSPSITGRQRNHRAEKTQQQMKMDEKQRQEAGEFPVEVVGYKVTNNCLNAISFPHWEETNRCWNRELWPWIPADTALIWPLVSLPRLLGRHLLGCGSSPAPLLATQFFPSSWPLHTLFPRSRRFTTHSELSPHFYFSA